MSSWYVVMNSAGYEDKELWGVLWPFTGLLNIGPVLGANLGCQVP